MLFKDEKRNKMINDLWILYRKCVQDGPAGVNVKLVESVCEAADQFVKLYAYKDRFDEFLAQIYGALGALYMRQHKTKKAATAYEKSCLSLVGKESQRGRSSFIAETQPHFPLTACYATALNCFRSGDKEKGKHYYEELLRLTKRLFGSEDLEIVSLLYPQLKIENLYLMDGMKKSG